MKGFLVFFGFLLALDAFGLASAASFVDNGDQTVSDLQSGLTWDQRETTAMTWTAALSYCENLSFAGQTDWRLPNTKELSTLVDLTKSTTVKFDQTLFPTMKNSFYWASTTSNSSSTWAYDFSMSSAGSYTTYTKTNVADYVKCVRAGD